MNGIGQTFPIQRAVVVILDGQGQAHGWEITDGTAAWTLDGMRAGNSTAEVTLRGVFKRRTRSVVGLVDLDDIQFDPPKEIGS